MVKIGAEVVGYVRVSTPGQVQEGVSLDDQRARIQEWAGSRGSTVYADEGVSGSRTRNRPGFQKALAHVKKCRGVLVVASLSRLARSTRDALETVEDLAASGAGLVSLSESVDTTTAMGKFFLTLLAGLAQMERDIASERTKAALGHLRFRGRRVSGKIPFGFDLERDGSLTRNRSEQSAIALMRRWRAGGASFRSIADQLREKGIRTKEGNALWNASAVHSVLRRTTTKAA